MEIIEKDEKVNENPIFYSLTTLYCKICASYGQTMEDGIISKAIECNMLENELSFILMYSSLINSDIIMSYLNDNIQSGQIYDIVSVLNIIDRTFFNDEINAKLFNTTLSAIDIDNIITIHQIVLLISFIQHSDIENIVTQDNYETF